MAGSCSGTGMPMRGRRAVSWLALPRHHISTASAASIGIFSDAQRQGVAARPWPGRQLPAGVSLLD